MPEQFGPGSMPGPEGSMTSAKARAKQDDSAELLVAVLIGLGLRDYFRSDRLPLDDRQRAVRAIVMEASASLVSTTRDLIQGKVTPRVWYLRMRDILASSSLAATMALLGKDTLSDGEIAGWVTEFNLQDGYLARFRDQIREGEQILNEGAIGRADLYARAIWSVSNRVLGDVIAAASGSGPDAVASAIGAAAAQAITLDPSHEGPTKLQAIRVRHSSDSCADCVAWEGLGWIDADSGDFHEIGTSICGSRCKCHYIYRTVPA